MNTPETVAAGGHTAAPTVTDIVNASKGRWPHILHNMGINVPENNKHGACPKCGGKDRFRFDDKNGKGTWFCNHCGNGDGLDLITLVTGKDIKSSCHEINSRTRGTAGRRAHRWNRGRRHSPRGC